MSAIVEMPVTMTSLELLDLVNEARADAGEPNIRANVFADRIKDELDGEHYKSFVVQNLNGTQSEVFELTSDQCMLVSMRESKAVRRKVLAKLNALASKLNQQSAATLPTYSDALRQLADQIDENTRLSAERDHAIATKALIGSKREASAMAKASALSRENNALLEELGRNQKHATVIAVERASGRKLPKTAYVPLRRWCKAHGIEANDVPDERHGSVKAWPAGAWLEAHGIDLVELFADGGKAA
ncbi:hypothetical protein [Azotobacter beijerinckii]|uniref:hypothetical protein n=1 Tax=Azotobacter beijerinckii TaxID=170623 RepID=UPI002953C1D4|nr:hypothetical protein [Azotobacter beijerinckii]MDV7210132.1 hypothetical protein [Azotobacter beijerinckii]